jgi:hypothetical protein
MTRDQVNRTLSHMERIRMDSYEADTPAEEKRLTAEYGRLWRAIEPYVSGREPYTARLMPRPRPAPEQSAPLDPELLAIIEGLAAAQARKDYAAWKARSEPPDPAATP